MANYNPVDYSPEIPEFPVVNPFLPCYGKFNLTTYIQGASDYEIMANLVQLYNTVAKAINSVEQLSKDTVKAYNQLQTFVNEYFANLDVQKEINNKLDAMYSSGELAQLLGAYIDYVTPQMFGAKGDGLNDDTNAIIAALSNSSKVVFPKGTYKCTSTIDVTGKTIIGTDSTLDFSECTGDYAIKSTDNGTHIDGIRIINATKVTYAIALLYFANGCSWTNSTVKNSNGVLLSGCWYSNFNNITIATMPDSPACLTIDNTYASNALNGISFNNISLQYGKIGIKFINCTVNSDVFNGIAIENQTEINVQAVNTFGNISFNGVYFETHDAQKTPLIFDTGTLTVDINNIIIRGPYVQFANDNNRIMLHSKPYNPSNIKLNCYYQVYPRITSNCVAPIFLSNNNIRDNIIIKPVNDTSFSITLNNTSPLYLHLIGFGRDPNDTFTTACDLLDIYCRANTSEIVATYKGNSIGDRAFDDKYKLSAAVKGEKLVITVSNTSTFYPNYRYTYYVNYFSPNQLTL